MSGPRGFALPDLGEGLTEAELLSWSVAQGDAIAVDAPMCEVETAKAVVELPAPFAGTVARLHAEPGDTVAVGDTLISIDPGGDGRKNGEEGEADGDGGDGAPVQESGPTLESSAPPTLVGSGPLAEGSARAGWRRRPGPASSGAARNGGAPGRNASGPVPAEPAARSAARQLGIDLAAVPAARTDGVVTRDDVRRYADSAGAPPGRPPAGGGATGAAGPTRTDAADGRPVRADATRRATAEAVASSAAAVPHASAFRTADVTDSLQLLDRLRTAPDYARARLSPLTLAANAAVTALRRHGIVNALWDAETGGIVHRDGVNLSIAVATPRGLTVPTIRNADRMGLRGLAEAITRLVDEARTARSSVSDLTGGTFTITNIGVFGLEGGTAIIPPGQSAILSLGAVARAPRVRDGDEAIVVRSVATLGLTFDHRLIDGEQAGAFLATVAEVLENPLRLAE